MDKDMKRQFGSSAILLSTAIIWGFAFVAQVFGTRYLDAYTFNASRFLLGGIVLIPVCFLFEREKMTREKWKKMLFAALCAGTATYIPALLQQCGMEISPNPGKAGFITGIYTVLTPILYFLVLRRRSGIQIWIGGILAAVGLYLLCYDGTGISFGFGELLLFACAVFWAVQIIVVDHFAADLSPIKFACLEFLVCGLLNLITAFLFGEPSFGSVWNGRWAILFCGVFSTAIGFTGQIVGQRMAKNPTRAAILMSTEALFSVIGGMLWNLLPIDASMKVEASLNSYGIVGCVVIFIAIILSQIPTKAPQRQSEA